MTLPSYAMNRESFPEAYERFLVGPLFRPWAEVLIDRVGLAVGDGVLDVACGTGIVARLAAERLGATARIVGIDLSPQMLAVGRALAPTVDWREGNAAALPCDDRETFDVVFCQQGLQFFPDRVAAIGEMKRVLAPAGRLGVSTWCSLQDNSFFSELHAVAQKHLGVIVDQRHAFGDRATLQAVLVDGGFRDVQVERRSQTMRFSDAAQLLRLNTMALVGMSEAAKQLGEEERTQAVTAIIGDSSTTLASCTDGEGLHFELASNLATARK